MHNYALIFINHYGDPPWKCYSCGEEILRYGQGASEGRIHHLNEDRTDNDISNLVAVHAACHARLHLQGKHRSQEVRDKIRATLIGQPHTPERRNSLKNAWVSRRDRESITCDCGKVIVTPWNFTQHQRVCETTRKVIK